MRVPILTLSTLLLFSCQSILVAKEAPQALVDPAWAIQYENPDVRFRGLHIVDENTVWASGTGGRVARTTDGGASWDVRVVPGAESLDFRDVHAFSADLAFILSIGEGGDSRIYRTSNGGEHWELSFKNEDPKAFFDHMSFWDEDRGFAFSDSYDGEFVLIQTSNGGASWERIDPALVPDARPGEAAFAASGTGVVTRPGGLGWFCTGASAIDTRVIRTEDYGATWREAITPIPSTRDTEGIYSMSFLDDHHGAIFGGDYTQTDAPLAPIAVTADGGDTWKLVTPSTLGVNVAGGAYVPGTPTLTLVVVSGAGSEYSTDNGQTWHRIDDNDYKTVAFLSPTVGWAAGEGNISRFVNGGGGK